MSKIIRSASPKSRPPLTLNQLFGLFALLLVLSAMLLGCSTSSIDQDYAGMPNKTFFHMGAEFRIHDIPASSKMLISSVSSLTETQRVDSFITSLALSHLSAAARDNCLIVGITAIGSDRWEVQYACQSARRQ